MSVQEFTAEKLLPARLVETRASARQPRSPGILLKGTQRRSARTNCRRAGCGKAPWCGRFFGRCGYGQSTWQVAGSAESPPEKLHFLLLRWSIAQERGRAKSRRTPFLPVQ